MKVNGSINGNSDHAIPKILIESLEVLEDDAIVLAPDDATLYTTDGVESLGIIRDLRLTSDELLAIVRVVRRTGNTQIGKIEVPRGPIGEGRHELTVTVALLGDENFVLILIRDESEATRIHEIRRDFIANISHELKTPIGALSLLSEAVLGAKDDPESVTKFATRMQSEAKRLTDLVQEIISLSKLQDSDPLREPQECSVSDLIEVAVDQCHTLAESRKVAVAGIDIENEIIMGDREQLVMAIHNLIENAVNYSPEATKVSVTTKIDDGIIEIAVTDQGIGIPEAEQGRIFERFYRIDPARSRQTGGTGLGLSIVKHIAAKHGGEVKVWSSQGVGSTFSLRLPIAMETNGVN